jgi:yeast amino acid transporter
VLTCEPKTDSLSNRFIDPSWGFAMGWNYVIQWAFVLPLELTVCGTVIQYWAAETSVAIWVGVSLQQLRSLAIWPR